MGVCARPPRVSVWVDVWAYVPRPPRVSVWVGVWACVPGLLE